MATILMKTVATQTRYFTMEQVKAMHSSPDHYLCFITITTDGSTWKIGELAKRINLPESVVNSVKPGS